MTAQKIYLADLTHDGLILSSNVFPLSVGLIAAHVVDQRGDDVDVELFKYPHDFSMALEKDAPRIVGFANYSWNSALSRAYAQRIKQHWPDTVVIFGGPNYGLTEEEVDTFWSRNRDVIDFYIVKEGEEAFLQLLDALSAVDFNVAALKAERTVIGNVHYEIAGEIVTGPDLPRIRIEDLPSPYMMGLMDKFFDEKLCPLIHTTRGCPFKCAFCTEGAPYYNVVQQRVATLEQEMRYISVRVNGPKDLFISDANFGMFKQDIDKAKTLVDCQKEFGYPQYIHVSTGKNQKERVVDIVKSLGGAISMAASLQSTDETVLENVERSNISVDQLMTAGKKANTENMGTYSELILGLPGDSIPAHKGSLRDTVEMRFDNIRMYQLIMLPQTKLNTPELRRQHDMRTKFRIMPRSFGRYTLKGETFAAVESEEILISNATMPFEDYIACREMDLTIEVLHNGRVYSEVVGVCDTLGLSWFDLIMAFYDKRRNMTDEITAMYDTFRRGTSEQLWDDEASLSTFVTDNIDEMLTDERGTNEMSSGKATAFFVLFDQINQHLFDLLKEMLEVKGVLDDATQQYLDELQRYSYLRKKQILTVESVEEAFALDLEKIQQADYRITPADALLSDARPYEIGHNTEQKSLIDQYAREFSSNHDGLGKMLMRYPHVHRLFRNGVSA